MEKKFRYLVPGDYMADPAVHVFDGKLYIYPSHDRESGVEENDNGDHFDMCDYHVFSTEDVMNGTVTDHGVVLKVSDIPWAGRQLWDCDVARKTGTIICISIERPERHLPYRRGGERLPRRAVHSPARSHAWKLQYRSGGI